MNRALSMLFALVMVLTVFPVMTSTATAAETEAQAPTADDLYVTNGLVIWLDGEDASSVDLANNAWKSKVGDVVATIGGTWKEGRNAGSYRFDIQQPGMDYGLFLPITALPTEDYTIDINQYPFLRTLLPSDVIGIVRPTDTNEVSFRWVQKGYVIPLEEFEIKEIG